MQVFENYHLSKSGRCLGKMIGVTIVILSVSGAAVVLWSDDRDSLSLLIAVSFLVIGIAGDRHLHDIPFVLRPTILIAVSVFGASLSVGMLSDFDRAQYSGLWLLQMVGFLLAVTAFNIGRTGDKFVARRYPNSMESDSRRGGSIIGPQKNPNGLTDLLSRRFFFAWIVLFALGLVFFAWKGVPVLAGSVEQAREDAATSGTGLFRLAAYLTIPVSLLLMTINRRRWPLYILVSACMVVGTGNRSPLVYLAAPLVFWLVLVRKPKMPSIKVIAGAALLLVAVGAFGAYRILTQPEFALYDLYAESISKGDFWSIAWLAIAHYATVVPDNAVMTKSFIDSGIIPLQHGASYFTLFITAIPGVDYLPLDRQIRLASGKSFAGGGIPPTLMGEGYANFGAIGVTLEAFFVMLVLLKLANNLSLKLRYVREGSIELPVPVSILALLYGQFATWFMMAQIAGLAGASTFPMAASLLLTVAYFYTTRSFKYAANCGFPIRAGHPISRAYYETDLLNRGVGESHLKNSPLWSAMAPRLGWNRRSA